MEFRHEWKHEISYSDLITLRQRLSAIAQRDKHSINGKYEIRSMYFDDMYDTALREKLDGVAVREKFRIRYYNGDKSFICLEKKSKVNGLCSKQSVLITESEAQSLVDGDYSWMKESGRELVTELYSKMMSRGIMPKTIVDYTREPFVYPYGNVRVTIDYNIRTGLMCTDFLNPDCITVTAGEPVIILEVKWDEFLPSVIKRVVQLDGCRSQAFSKYAACRIYG